MLQPISFRPKTLARPAGLQGRILAVIACLTVAAQLTSAQIVSGIRNFFFDEIEPNPAILAAVPKLLSQTGIYTGIATSARKISDTNSIVSFEVNSPLWTDGSSKERFISLPPGTARVIPTDTANYSFPAKTVLIKNFMIDTIVGNPASRIYVETRILVYQSGAKTWSGLSYQWRRNQSDADLIPPESDSTYVHGVRLNGTLVGKRWLYPSSKNCRSCHIGNEVNAKRGALGFITPQLNRIINGANQLQRLVDKGVLSNNPVAGKPNAHRWYGLKETSATLEQRARSYFAANCSHCHENNHGLTVNHQFDYFNPARKITTVDDPIGGYLGLHPKGNTPLLTPGNVTFDSSVILEKMMHRVDQLPSTSLENSQMPPIATSQPDSAAVLLIKDWICSMKPNATCTLSPWLPDDTFWADSLEISVSIRKQQRAHPQGMAIQPQILNHQLFIPANMTASNKVVLRDHNGRTIPIQSMGSGFYKLPAGLNRGVYLVSVGTVQVRLNYLP